MHKGFIISLLLLWQAYPSYAGMSVFFTPSDKCEISIIGEINKAEENIDAAVYAINNQDIVDALKDAHRRGVKIRILTDRLQASQKKSKVRELHDFGINIRVNSKHKIEHNKFAVFDAESVVTGSFNWTEPAVHKNEEVCDIFVDDPQYTAQHQKLFDQRWADNSEEKSDKWLAKKQKERAAALKTIK